jgi:hypothetical protein
MGLSVMSADIEQQIDVQLSEVARIDAELRRLDDTLRQLLDESRGAGELLEKSTAAQAAAELRARLDGLKPPKVAPEVEVLRGQAARLAATHAAGGTLFAELQSSRAAAVAEADRLARRAAMDEFAIAEKEVGQAWRVLLAAFGRYSAAAYFSNQQSGWNGLPTFGGPSHDICDGVRVQRPDMDTGAYQAAIAASQAAAMRSKLDAIG